MKYKYECDNCGCEVESDHRNFIDKSTERGLEIDSYKKKISVIDSEYEKYKAEVFLPWFFCMPIEKYRLLRFLSIETPTLTKDLLLCDGCVDIYQKKESNNGE